MTKVENRRLYLAHTNQRWASKVKSTGQLSTAEWPDRVSSYGVVTLHGDGFVDFGYGTCVVAQLVKPAAFISHNQKRDQEY